MADAGVGASIHSGILVNDELPLLISWYSVNDGVEEVDSLIPVVQDKVGCVLVS